MTTLVDKSLLSGGDNKPSMLEKHLYDSWKSIIELYMMNRPHGRMILASVEKVNQQSKFSQLDSGLTIPVFKHGDYPIDAINHVMSFLSAVVTSAILQLPITAKGNLKQGKQPPLDDGKE
ncbi:hypothetical protein Tco_0530581 [Tanacetum coccineum]